MVVSEFHDLGDLWHYDPSHPSQKGPLTPWWRTHSFHPCLLCPALHLLGHKHSISELKHRKETHLDCHLNSPQASSDPIVVSRATCNSLKHCSKFNRHFPLSSALQPQYQSTEAQLSSSGPAWAKHTQRMGTTGPAEQQGIWLQNSLTLVCIADFTPPSFHTDIILSKSTEQLSPQILGAQKLQQSTKAMEKPTSAGCKVRCKCSMWSLNMTQPTSHQGWGLTKGNQTHAKSQRIYWCLQIAGCPSSECPVSSDLDEQQINEAIPTLATNSSGRAAWPPATPPLPLLPTLPLPLPLPSPLSEVSVGEGYSPADASPSRQQAGLGAQHFWAMGGSRLPTARPPAGLRRPTLLLAGPKAGSGVLGGELGSTTLQGFAFLRHLVGVWEWSFSSLSLRGDECMWRERESVRERHGKGEREIERNRCLKRGEETLEWLESK